MLRELAPADALCGCVMRACRSSIRRSASWDLNVKIHTKQPLRAREPLVGAERWEIRANFARGRILDFQLMISCHSSQSSPRHSKEVEWRDENTRCPTCFGRKGRD